MLPPRWEDPHPRAAERPVGPEAGPQLAASRERGPQSYSHKELGPANALKEPGGEFPLRAPIRKAVLTDGTWILARCHLCRTSDLQTLRENTSLPLEADLFCQQ